VNESKQSFLIAQLISNKDKTFTYNFSETGQSKNKCLDVLFKYVHPNMK